MTRTLSRIARRCLALAMLLAGAVPALAQSPTGTVEGTISDAGGEPVQGAQVLVVGTSRGTISDAEGRFTITAVPAGTHALRVVHIGFRELTQSGVVVRADQTTRVMVSLEAQAVALGGVVVSASRRAERVTEAPATISRIEGPAIDNAVGPAFANALKEVKGIDFIQVGVASVGINARGFNSSFNNRMLMMEDGRVAVLAESGLPIGSFTTTPKVDLAGMEVLVGPGAALYGADASSGVVYLQTKDPRQFPGTTVEVTGGSRSYKDVQFRHAGVSGDWGYKFAGEFLDVDDWDNVLNYGGVKEDELAIPINWNTRVLRGSGAVSYYRGESALTLSAGMSENDGVGQTNVGRNQFTDWRYNNLQLRYTSPSWYFTAYRTQSQSGESFALNRMADAMKVPANADLSADSLRKLSDWPSDGRIYAAELQNNFTLAPLAGTQITWGAQLRRDVVSSDRQWLTDRQTGEDIQIDQYGVYGQAEAPLTQKLDLILAGRVDKHENYETQFSPKAGLVFKPAEGQALRATYNRAFKSPTILQTNFHIPDWTSAVAIFGNTRGYTVKYEDGSVKATYDALVPEENTTWELGYKGVLQDRLFVDLTAYRSNYTNFLSPLVIVSDPFGLGLAGDAAGVKSFAYDADGELMEHSAGYPPVMLIYYNLGEARLTGMDAGLNYLLTDNVSLKGTLSYVKLNEVEVPAGREEATALNSPEWKWTAGVDVARFGSFFGGLTLRHVGEYYFRSGINKGMINGFTTLDMSVGYRMPWEGATLNLGVNNLFSCGGDFTYDTTPGVDPHFESPTGESRSCGSGRKHFEMINMPKIGTMVYLGVRYQR